MALPSGIVTFLFTDVVGSSNRWDQATDQMAAAIDRHDALVAAAMASNSGHVVKKMGDGFMAVFADPADAVSAAVDVQRSIQQETWDPTLDGISVRIGVHTGPVERQPDGDYLGPTVNRSARIEAAGHGDQVLVSAATRELIGDRRPEIGFRDLGEHHLRGLSRPERIYQVEVSGLGDRFPPLRTETTPTNLPPRLRTMVGRDADLTAVGHALSDARLLTIAGAGGAGKTTLAMETARAAAHSFPAGVWLVELAGLSDGRRVATEILGSIRRAATPNRDHVDVLVEHLAGQRVLLVLDNCEHIVDDVATVAAGVLRGTESTTILATSREPLGVTGEVVWRIPTLSLPAGDDASDVMASGAGVLFADLARSSDAGFEVNDANSRSVADICRRLDGLPLAIELACARLRSMSVTDLETRLDDRFRVLRGRTADQPLHHRTLHDTVSWSYDLLDHGEQRLYRRLSVFAGGFDLEAAETLADGSADSSAEVLDGLDHLVAQSLVQHNDGRYRMLETIRQFGVAQLDERGELEEAQRSHLAWLAEIAQTGARQLEGRDQLVWLARFQAEIDNIRAAFAWAADHDPVAGAGIASSLTRFFWMNAMEADTRQLTDARSFLAEGYDWSTALLDAAGDDLPAKTRARLQTGIGGMLCIRAGRFDEALDRLAEAEFILREEGDDRGLGWAVFYDGIAGWGRRPAAATVARFEEALALHQAGGDKGGEIFATGLVAFALGSDDRVAEGRLHADRFIAAAEAIKVPNLVAHGADMAAMFDAWQNTVDDHTVSCAVAALEMFRANNNYACVTHALGAASMVLARRRNLEAAATAVGISEAIRDRLNMVLAPYEDRREIAADLMSEVSRSTAPPARSHEDDWASAIAHGRTMEPDEGIDWTILQLGLT